MTKKNRLYVEVEELTVGRKRNRKLYRITLSNLSKITITSPKLFKQMSIALGNVIKNGPKY